jgi:hypothetical protein
MNATILRGQRMSSASELTEVIQAGCNINWLMRW